MVLSIGRESFVWAVGSLCDLHRVPYDAELLLGRFRSPYDTASLQQTALAYDSKDAHQKSPVNDIHPTVFPALAKLKSKELQITQAEYPQETQPKALPKHKFNKNQRQQPFGFNCFLSKFLKHKKIYAVDNKVVSN